MGRHGWATVPPGAVRHWPTSPCPVGAGGVAIAVLHDDRRYLVRANVDEAAETVEWVGVASYGLRDIRAVAGSFRSSVVPSPATLAFEVATASGRRSRDPAHATLDDERGLHAFKALWDDSRGWDGEAAAALASFLDHCGHATLPVATLGLSREWLQSLDRLAGRDAVDASLLRTPILVPVLATLSAGLRREEVRKLALPLLDPVATPAALSEALRACVLPKGIRTTGDDGSLRRILKVSRGTWLPVDDARTALRLAHLAPRDWMPGDRAGIAHMATVLRVVHELSRKSRGALAPATMLASVRGDWARAAAALAANMPSVARVPTLFADDARDMCAALDSELLRPLQALVTGRVPPVDGRDVDRGLAAPWSLLFGGKGIVAVSEAMADWHARGAGMTRRIRAISPMTPSRWPRTFRDHVAPNGMVVSEILDAAGLLDEGSELAHCVATYAAGCAKGEYAILSVRSPDGWRSSTAQVGPGRSVSQHRGAGNALPDERDREALASCLVADGAASGSPRAVVDRLHRRAFVLVAGLYSRARRATSGAWHGRLPYAPTAANVALAQGVWSRYLPRAARGDVAGLAHVVAPPTAVGTGTQGEAGAISGAHASGSFAEAR